MCVCACRGEARTCVFADEKAPWSRCRTCSSLASFSAQARQQSRTKTKTAAADASTSAEPGFGSESGLRAARASPPPPPRETDCPADVEVLGRSSWTLLHTMAATYPERPSASQQSDLLSFMRLFARLYPCWVCAEDFQRYMGRERPRVGSRDDFGMWLCGAHNEVNRKLGKREFDCSRWEERWRTGWKDGRCD